MNDDLAERLEGLARGFEALGAAVGSPRTSAQELLRQAATSLRSQAEEIKRLREALGKRSYVLSGPHLSGYTLTLGFGTLADAQAAHDAVARFPAADAKP